MPSKLTSRLRLDKRTLSLIGWNLTGDFGPATFYTTRTGRIAKFARSPPLNPPTAEQIAQRQRFTNCGAAWAALTKEQRANWERACRRASLSITGYNFFVYYQMRGDLCLVRTIERQTGITLIP